MPERFYRDALIEIDPDQYKDDTFHYSSVYFDQNSRKNVLCAFEPLDGCTSPPSAPSNIRLNKDAVKQVDNLMAQSQVATIVLTLLIASFSIVVSMSTTLAVSAFVHSNEKTLAILKAFRAGTKNLLIILNANTIVLFCNALLLAALICSAGRWAIVDLLNNYNTNVSIDFGLGFSQFLLAAFTIYLILITCSCGVIIGWNRKNKYVGEILQSV